MTRKSSIYSPSGALLAEISNVLDNPSKIEFVSDEADSQQVALMRRPKGEKIPAHWHPQQIREISDTTEVLIVFKGKIEAQFYDELGKVCQSVILRDGDVAQLLKGGHGFKVLENTLLVEVKQGPFHPRLDKVYIEEPG